MRSPLQRFWVKVQVVPTGCWLWTGARGKKGYGRFRPDASRKGVDRRVMAHRFAYEIFIGEVPEGLQLDHLCRNHACVNPNHLEVVTSQENIKRGESGRNNRLKTHCPRGHPYNGANTYKNRRGSRCCRVCAREATRRWRANKRKEGA